MPSLAVRPYQSHPVKHRRRQSLPSYRSAVRADELEGSVLYWGDEWNDPEETEMQFLESSWQFLESSWASWDKLHAQIRAWRRPDYNDIRSYSLPVSESFQIASREYTTINIDPDIMSGAPCIAGTRIPVYMILDAVEYYGSPELVLKSYPRLTPEQVRDAIGFAKIVVECPLGDDEP